MDKCVLDLYKAASLVEPKYYNAIGTNRNGGRYPQYIEQSFSAELYHQFRLLMEDSRNIPYYRDLTLNFDITKASVNMRPDLVLHKSQSNRNDQRLFIEVKTDPDVDIEADIRKLFQAISEPLVFKQAALVTVRRKERDIRRILDGLGNELAIDHAQGNRIFFLNIPSSAIHSDLTINSLNELRD